MPAIPTRWKSLAAAAGILAIGAHLSVGRRDPPPDPDGHATTRPNRKASVRPETGRTDRTAREAAVNRWYERLLADHPGLAVDFREVPDEENGFLQWLRFVDGLPTDADGRPTLGLPGEIRGMLPDPEKWDAARFSTWLAENRDLVDQLLALGLLPDRSCRNLPASRAEFPAAGVARDSGLLLQLVARHALEQGDTGGALQAMRSVAGSARHFDGIETPTMLGATVSTLMRGSASRFVTGQLLAGRNWSAGELGEWRGILRSGDDAPAELANIVRGEWHVSSRLHLLPQLLSGEGTDGFGRVSDIDRLADRHAGEFEKESASIAGGSPVFPDARNGELRAESDSMHPDDRLIDPTLLSMRSWTAAWLLDRSRLLLADAAIAAAMGGETPVEPLSGTPYIIDREAGTITLPDDHPAKPGLGAPMKIPGLRR